MRVEYHLQVRPLQSGRGQGGLELVRDVPSLVSLSVSVPDPYAAGAVFVEGSFCLVGASGT